MHARRHSQSGFTLVEVLVASVVMLAGIAGLLAVFPQAYRSTKNAGRVSVLNHLALEKLDQLRGLDWAHADLAPGVHPALVPDSAGDFHYPVPGFPEAWSLRWQVLPGPTDAAGNPEPSMKTLVVEATYRTRYTSGGVTLATSQSLEARVSTCVSE